MLFLEEGKDKCPPGEGHRECVDHIFKQCIEHNCKPHDCEDACHEKARGKILGEILRKFLKSRNHF